MPTHIALLRGINVGSRNRVAMADLRKVVLGLGYTDVATYIQSGNVVFTSEEADTAMIAAALERAIAEHLSVRPKVVVLTHAELARVVADNPFPEEPNLRWVHAIFRNGPSGPTSSPPWQRPAASPRPGSDHEARVVGNTLFLHTPGGLGRSELAARLLRLGGSRTAEPAGTARNWATVNKLLALCDT